MGQLVYAASAPFDFDDRVLSHVKIAVGAKLRRKESFYLGWTIPSERGSGRMAIWLSPSIPLQFRFRSNAPGDINRAWIHAMEQTAMSGGVMTVLDESDVEEYLRRHS